MIVSHEDFKAEFEWVIHFFYMFLFIWLYWALVVACKLLVAACGI